MQQYPYIRRRNAENLTGLAPIQPFDLAQGEGLGLAAGQGAEAVAEDRPELLLFQGGARVVPHRGRGAPVAPVVVLEQGVDVLVGTGGGDHGLLAGVFTQVIDEFVLEDSDKPGAFFGTAGESLLPRQRREEGVLYQIF